jgi:hypothetical protein
MNFGADQSFVIGVGTFCSDLPVKNKMSYEKVLHKVTLLHLIIWDNS